MLTSSHVVCRACAAGHTLQGSQAKALMPHLMTLEWGSIMHVGACNTGHMGWHTQHNASMSSHQCCQLTGTVGNLSIGTMHNEQALLSEATDLLSMLS